MITFWTPEETCIKNAENSPFLFAPQHMILSTVF